MTALWPHQVEAVEFILRWKKAAAWHDTGTGKTRTGIEIADQIGATSILVLCPPIAVEMWKMNFEAHGQVKRAVTIVRSPDAALHTCDVVIVPFSLISKYPKLAKRLRQYQFGLIIIDEAHALKGMDSARTRSIYAIGSETGGLADRAPYVALLSATLTPNGFPSELYSHLRALRPELLGPAQGYDTFIARYCEIKTDWRGGAPIERIVGAKKATVPDLTRRLATFVHRVKKKDVQKDLPPFTVDVWPVNIDDLVVPDELKREWEAVESLLAHDVGRASGEEALAIARASPHAATNRRLTGLIKLQAAFAVLAPELEAGRKVISFAYHRDVIAAIEKRFRTQGVVTLDGSTSPAKRIVNVKAFREDPKIRLFNGQITIAEVIDLTPCSLMWILESDWAPRVLTQAVGRANRPGQIEPLTVWILTLSGSIDDALARVLTKKGKDIEALETV